MEVFVNRNQTRSKSTGYYTHVLKWVVVVVVQLEGVVEEQKVVLYLGSR